MIAEKLKIIIDRKNVSSIIDLTCNFRRSKFLHVQESCVACRVDHEMGFDGDEKIVLDKGTACYFTSSQIVPRQSFPGEVLHATRIVLLVENFALVNGHFNSLHNDQFNSLHNDCLGY